MRLVLRSRAWKPLTGREQLLDAPGEVTEPLVPQPDGNLYQGMVRMHGELWRAVSQQAIPAGAQVRVTRIDGLTLHVVLAGPAATSA
jgi:membrane-bound serine protease (ClpP class)